MIPIMTRLGSKSRFSESVPSLWGGFFVFKARRPEIFCFSGRLIYLTKDLFQSVGQLYFLAYISPREKAIRENRLGGKISLLPIFSNLWIR